MWWLWTSFQDAFLLIVISMASKVCLLACYADDDRQKNFPDILIQFITKGMLCFLVVRPPPTGWLVGWFAVPFGTTITSIFPSPSCSLTLMNNESRT